jgi:hypothetical protein
MAHWLWWYLGNNRWKLGSSWNRKRGGTGLGAPRARGFAPRPRRELYLMIVPPHWLGTPPPPQVGPALHRPQSGVSPPHPSAPVRSLRWPAQHRCERCAPRIRGALPERERVLVRLWRAGRRSTFCRAAQMSATLVPVIAKRKHHPLTAFFCDACGAQVQRCWRIVRPQPPNLNGSLTRSNARKTRKSFFALIWNSDPRARSNAAKV